MNQVPTARELVDSLATILAANPALGDLPAVIISESDTANVSLQAPFKYYTEAWPNGEERLIIFNRK